MNGEALKIAHLLNGLEHSITPAFEPQNPREKLGLVECIVILVLERRRQVDPWRSLVSQTYLI